MTRTCTVCVHPEREAIDEALVAGAKTLLCWERLVLAELRED